MLSNGEGVWHITKYRNNAVSTLLFVLLFSTSLSAANETSEASNKTASNKSIDPQISVLLRAIKSKYEQAETAAQPMLTPPEETASPLVLSDLEEPLPVNELMVGQDNTAAGLKDPDKQTQLADTNLSSTEINEIPDNRRFQVGEELLLSLFLRDLYLGDILAISSLQGVKVSLSELVQVVDFAIDVNIDEGTAEGWYLSPNNKFKLSQDAQQKFQVSVNGEIFNVANDEVELSDDIYIELTRLSEWFEFEWRLQEATLGLEITPIRPFPIEQRLSRQKRRVAKNQGLSESVLPVKENGYKLFSVPLIDAQIGIRTTDVDTTGSYSILSSQDTAYFNSQLFINGNDDDALIDARVTLSQFSDKADLLGPLNATEYSFGDIVPVNAGTGATQALGLGFSVNNLARKLADNRVVNLDGEIQVGWDIELFRNGVLIANEINVSDGRYEFNDLELGFGENNFELVFYGPRGEIERRYEQFFVDSNTVTTGQSAYQFSVTETNQSVFGVNDLDDDPRQQGTSVNAVYNYGVTDWLSVGVGSSLFFPEEGEDVQQFSFRSDLVLGSFGLLNSIFQLNDNQQRNMQHTFRTSTGAIGWDMSYTHNEVLNEAVIQTLVKPTSETFNIRMSGTLFRTSNLPISYQNNYQRGDFSSGNKVEQVISSLGVNSRWGSLSNNVVWQKQTLFNPDPLSEANNEPTLSGSLGYRIRINKVNTRLFSNYEIEPTGNISSVGASLSYPISNNISSELRYAHELANNSDRYDFRINWFGESISLSGIANYSDSDDWGIRLNARMGVGFDSTTNTLFTSGRSLSQGGALIVRMFEDENLDQQYTEGEPVLENVEIEAVQAFRRATTNEDGLAVLKALPAGKQTDIFIDKNSLSEAVLMIASEGFSVEGRRGSVQQFDVAVVRGGEIEGMLYQRDENGDETEVAYARMSLVDGDGNVLQSIRSEYDGYYLFTEVFPGDYFIQVDTSSGKQRGLTADRLKQVKVSNRGDLFLDIDFVLRELKEAEGFVASIGEFSSLGMLKVYFNLVSSRVGTEHFEDVFYYQASSNGKYILGLNYAESANQESKQTIQQYCNTLVSLDVNCKVESVNIKY